MHTAGDLGSRSDRDTGFLAGFADGRVGRALTRFDLPADEHPRRHSIDPPAHKNTELARHHRKSDKPIIHIVE